MLKEFVSIVNLTGRLLGAKPVGAPSRLIMFAARPLPQEITDQRINMLPR